METHIELGGIAAVVKVAGDRFVVGEPYKISATFGGLLVHLCCDDTPAVEKRGCSLTFHQSGEITVTFGILHNHEKVGIIPVSFNVLTGP